MMGVGSRSAVIVEMGKDDWGLEHVLRNGRTLGFLAEEGCGAT